MRIKRGLFVCLLLLGIYQIRLQAQWQISQTGQVYTIDFDNTLFGVNAATFSGTGYSPMPQAGALDSDAWAVYGFSAGDLRFGDSASGGDFGRGFSTGSVSSGGIYAFDIDSSAASNIALGVQSGGSDFTPGYHLLRIENATVDTISQVDVSYKVYIYNDQNRSTLTEFYWGLDTINFYHESVLDVTSTAPADTLVSWQYYGRAIQINTIIFPGDFLYLKWLSDDAAGSGSRDEIALDDITVQFQVAGNLPPVISEVGTDPDTPQAGQLVDVIASISDQDGIDTAYIRWGLDSALLANSIGMMALGADSFVTASQIPGQTDSTKVYYQITALDQSANPLSDTSGIYQYQVLNPLPVAVAGDLLITEIMANPSSVSDARGEYFELYNAGQYTYDLMGYKIEDAGSDSIEIESHLRIHPREFLVLARDSDRTMNGGFVADYQYSGLSLSNLNDELYLLSPVKDTIDKVEYTGSSFLGGGGLSLEYIGASHQDNNDMNLWSEAVKRESGFTGTAGDKGSPGEEGTRQVVDQLVYVGGSWSEVPDSGSGQRQGLIRRGEVAQIAGYAQVRSLRIEPLAGLDMGSNKLVVNDTLFMLADSAGYAQLIGEVDGQVSWSSFLQSIDARWFNLGIPLNATLDQVSLDNGGLINTLSDVNGDTGAVNIWYYQAGLTHPVTGQGSWLPVPNPGFSTMGTGMSLYLGPPFFGQLPQFLTAIGTVENTYRQFNLHNLAGPAQYNFLANPFPCAISWDEITADNPGVNKTYFIYDEGPDSAWVAYNALSGTLSGSAGEMIAPGQAFFVNANGQAVLDIEKDSRSIQNNPPLYRKVVPPGVSIKALTAGGRKDYTYLGFINYANDSLDPGIDALKRINYAGATPSIYSVNDQAKFMYNFMADVFIEKSIPVSLEHELAEDIVFQFDLFNIDPGWTIELEDHASGAVHDLRSGTYKFAHNSGKRTFSLNISSSVINAGPDYSDPFNKEVYLNGQLIYQGSLERETTKVRVCDITGKEVTEVRVGEKDVIEIDHTPLSNGVYILSFQTEDGRVFKNVKFFR